MCKSLIGRWSEPDIAGPFVSIGSGADDPPNTKQQFDERVVLLRQACSRRRHEISFSAHGTKRIHEYSIGLRLSVDLPLRQELEECVCGSLP